MVLNCQCPVLSPEQHPHRQAPDETTIMTIVTAAGEVTAVAIIADSTTEDLTLHNSKGESQH
jgi:hypothetical protein